MKKSEIVVWALFGLLALFLLGVAGFIFRVVSETAQVFSSEAGPRALLRKYEWFKDVSAELDAKAATIIVYERQRAALAKAQTREDREQEAILDREIAGLKASYNRLCASYNSAMARENWRYCNRGELPKGATEPLPREYKTYLER